MNMTSSPSPPVAHHAPFTRPFRKRSFENDEMGSSEKRQKYYYFRLESETSHSSEEDTESVCSLQEKDTDTVRDTSDTEEKSGSEYEVEIEYEIASETDEECPVISSSSDEDFVLAAAAAIYNNAIETFVTDGEESDTSSQEEVSFTLKDFSTCIKCKGSNDNPCYRYCEKCFQDRKTFFPPRPRRKRSKARGKKSPPRQNSVSGLCQDPGLGSKGNKSPALPNSVSGLSQDSDLGSTGKKSPPRQNSVSGLSQDSGLGSSQECQGLNSDPTAKCSALDLNRSVVSKTLSENSTPTLESARTLDEGIGSSFSSAAPSSSGTLMSISSKVTPASGQSSSGSSLNQVLTRDTSTTGTIDHLKKRKRVLSESSLSGSDITESLKSKQLKINNSKKATIVTSAQAMPEKVRDVKNQSHSDLLSDMSAPIDIAALRNSVLTSTQSCTGSGSENIQAKDDQQNSKELCIVCNSTPKNGIFLHGNIAHMCCCYPCAIKTWRTIKRCPICSRRVNKVAKLYT